MDNENVTVSDGILLIKSKRGIPRIQKVLVKTKPGEGKNQVKCSRFQKYVNKKKVSSKIPVPIRNRKKVNNSAKNLKSLQSFEQTDENLLKLASKFKTDLGSSKIKYGSTVSEFESTICSLPSSSANSLKRKILESDQTRLHFRKKSSFGARSSDEDYSPLSIINSCSSLTQSDTTATEIKSSTVTFVQEPVMLLDEISEPISSYDSGDLSSNKVSSNTYPSETLTTPEIDEIDDKSITLSEDDFFPVDIESRWSPRKRTLQLQSSFIVMSQYGSTIRPPPSEGDLLSRTEENSEYVPDNESDTSGDEYYDRYIDSGLRPLRSDQSKLCLDAYNYKLKAEVIISEEDDIEPLLKEIPSDIFKKWKKPKKKEETPEEPSDLSKGDFVPSEEDVGSIPSEIIDDEGLKKLKQFEDIKYIIIDGDQKKDEFCIHTKDLPEGALTAYSSSTIGDYKPEKEKQRPEDSPGGDTVSLPFRKDDICIHTVDPPGSDSFSLDSSRMSINKKDSSKNSSLTFHQSGVKPSQSAILKKRDDLVVTAVPESTASSKKRALGAKSSSKTRSQSASSSESKTTLNHLLLASNKERRKSKSRSLSGNEYFGDTESQQTNSSYHSSGSSILLTKKKERRRKKNKNKVFTKKCKALRCRPAKSRSKSTSSANKD